MTGPVKPTASMTPDADRRPGETAVAFPGRADATVAFIGLIHTPWPDRHSCPRTGSIDGPDCRIEVDPLWRNALEGIEPGARMQVLYWMHLARRDLTRQLPRGRASPIGTFALRSPMRPNPIASSIVLVVARTGTDLLVRGLDCVDGTPLLDLKPERCPMTVS